MNLFNFPASSEPTMALRNILLLVVLLAGTLAANAAHSDTEPTQKPKFKYVSSANAGFSFFPLLRLERIPGDSVTVKEPQLILPPKEQIDSLISCPAAF